MSLHALATDMASKGRNGDSMLVHMTPSEVHGLQALAMKHGGSLTTNPDTGLPEANFLKSILPILAGLALGPAGMGIAFGGLSSAASAGLLVGGVTGLATGSLSKGLMAGLGAYGGAGLGGGLSDLGAGELAQGQISANMPTLAEGATQAQIADYTKQVNDLRTAGLQGASQLPMADKLSAGFSSAMASPTDALAFAKQNMMPLGAAAAPIVADMMVPTTTKMAPVQSPGRIREKRWDGRQFVDVASTDAGVFNTSNRSFSDLYRGYNNGGIVALAKGGDYTTLTKDSSADDIASAYKQFTTAGGGDTAANQKAATDYLTNLGIGQDKIGQAYGTYQASPTYTDYTQQNVTDYLTSNKNINIADETARLNANPLLVNQAISQLASGFLDPTQTVAGSGAQKYYDAYTNRGIDANELYAANLALNPNYAFDGQTGTAGLNALRRAFDVAKQFDTYEYGKAGGTELAKDVAFLKQYDAGNFTGDRTQQIKDIARETGLSLDEAARRYDAARAAMKPVITPITTVTGGTGNDVITAPITYKTDGTNTSGSLETTLGLPPGVSGAGITTVNPNGTITTRPDFSLEMRDVRDRYTKGGGSLGYTSPSFTNIDDFTKKYVTDRMSGDSLAAYEYLTGKKGAKYPTKSGVGQISEDYATAVLGYPARGNLPYIYNKATGKMDPNPDYVAPGRDAAGNVTYSMSLNDIKSSLKESPLSGQALYEWAMSNNLSAQQIADATGRSLSSVYADFRAGSKAATKKKEDDKTAGINTLVEGGGGGGDSGASSSGNSSSSSSSDGGIGTGGDTAKRGGLMGYAMGGATGYALGGLGTLGGYSDGGRLLKGPGDGVSDSIPATIGRKQQPARLADGEFVVPARIVSELGNGSTDAGAKKLYAMMDRVQRARGKTTGKNKVAANSRADKYLPA